MGCPGAAIFLRSSQPCNLKIERTLQGEHPREGLDHEPGVHYVPAARTGYPRIGQ